MSELDQEKRNTGAAAEESEIPQSAAARRLAKLGSEEREPIVVEQVGFFENFWYHHKWKTLILTLAVLVTIICTAQMCARESADIYLLYAGEGYMTPNEANALRDAFRQMMDDYNGDGERGILLCDINYLTEEQIAEREAKAIEEGVELIIDRSGNAAALERFEMEVIAGESVIYLLDPSLYENVKRAGGILPLSEILDTVPDYAVDEYSVRLADTAFGQYFTALHVLPQDTLLCIRRITTMSAFKGKEKTEALHQNHVELFRSIMAFELP